MRKKLLLFLLISINALFLINSQESLSVRMGQTFSDKFPNIETYVSVTSKGVSVPNLSPGNFTVRIDGKVQNKLKIDVTPFAYSDEGVDFHVLLSANGLMDGEPMDMQRKAVSRLYEKMGERDTLSFYIFGEEFQRVIEYKKKADIKPDEITKIKTLGMNPEMYDAIRFAAEATEKGPNRKRVIIIMSDGRNVGSTYDYKQTLALLKEKDVPLYSLGFVVTTGKNLSTLNQLSIASGGRYAYSTRDLGRIPAVMEYIHALIVESYVLKFKVKGVDADGKDHPIEIEVNHNELKGEYKKIFVAHKVPMRMWVIVLIIIAIIIGLIILIIIFIVARKKQRKKMGISNRRCPQCKRRMKDDWDECIFCKYLPPKKKKKKKKKDIEE